MIYFCVSWGMILFGAILTGIATEIVRVQTDAASIVAVIVVGCMGGSMAMLGILGLYELWKKQV